MAVVLSRKPGGCRRCATDDWLVIRGKMELETQWPIASALPIAAGTVQPKAGFRIQVERT